MNQKLFDCFNAHTQCNTNTKNNKYSPFGSSERERSRMGSTMRTRIVCARSSWRGAVRSSHRKGWMESHRHSGGRRPGIDQSVAGRAFWRDGSWKGHEKFRTAPTLTPRHSRLVFFVFVCMHAFFHSFVPFSRHECCYCCCCYCCSVDSVFILHHGGNPCDLTRHDCLISHFTN